MDDRYDGNSGIVGRCASTSAKQGGNLWFDLRRHRLSEQSGRPAQSGSPERHQPESTHRLPRSGRPGRGSKAIFNLENGFNMMTGGTAQNGRLFGRLSYVGLSNNDLGTLTLGRQYEAVKDYLGPVVIASNGVHIGDNDNGYNNLRAQNSVKYISPTFNNFNVTALYGFGEVAGDTSINRVMSIGSGYKSE